MSKYDLPFINDKAPIRKNLVSYYWTEDGEEELGEVTPDKAQDDCECYHCGRNIKAEENITYFDCIDGDCYIICNTCSNKIFRKE